MPSDTEYRRNNRTPDDEFKYIIHDSNILAGILRTYVSEFVGMEIRDIKKCMDLKGGGRVLDRNSERPTGSDPIRMDSVFEVKVPGSGGSVELIINLEGQNNPGSRGFMGNRMEYYLSQLIYSQKGVYFSGQNYQDMRKVYSIWFMLDPKKDYRNTVIKYGLKGEYSGHDPGVDPYDLRLTNLIVVNVGAYNDALSDQEAFSAALFSGDMDYFSKSSLMKQRFKVRYSEYVHRRVEKMVSIYEDSKTRYLKEGYDEGYDAGSKSERNELVSKFADHIVGISKNFSLNIEDLLGSLDSELKAEIRAEIERRQNQS